jgi:DNA polymerase III delta prime subunit
LKKSERKKEIKVFSTKDYELPENLRKWIEEHSGKKALYLSGVTGTGKTTGIKAFLAEKYGKEKVLRINNIQGLSKLNERDYEAIIFDDVDLSDLTGEEVIGLMDMEENHTQRILYGTAEVEAGTTRAFISNKKFEEMFKNLPMGQIEALLRRCVNVDLGNKRLVIRLELELKEDKNCKES